MDKSTISDHHDGHGLAECLAIYHDPRDSSAGGASHRYIVTYTPPDTANVPSQHVAEIQFQHGPREVAGSTPGCLESVLLAIVLDRLRAFNAGPFRSRQNAIAITKVEEAILWMKHRADERARRGVLGKNEA